MEGNASDIFAEHGITLSKETLAHVGVKGMRWGKRKKKSKKEPETATEKLDLKTTSDDDLKKTINRLKLEKEYRTLTAPQVSEGRKIVAEILKDVGKQHAKTYLNRELEKLTTPGGLKMATKLAVAASPKQAAARPVVKLAPKHLF